MKKLFALLGFIAAFTLLPTIVMADEPPNAGVVHRVSAWNLVGPYVINFNCPTCVLHNITITSYNPYTGAFNGYGTYVANPAYTWTISGNVVGNAVTMRILYTGQDAGYYVSLSGTIAANGTMSGMATDSSGGQFSWLTTSGVVKTFKNHGQFVRSQSDKRMAATFSFGMPRH